MQFLFILIPYYNVYNIFIILQHLILIHLNYLNIKNLNDNYIIKNN